MTIFYHRTTAKNAASILANGFRDATGHYGLPIEVTGVFLSEREDLGDQEIPDGAVFEIDLPLSEAELETFEIVEESKPYREWLVPASLINSRGTVRRI